MERFTTKIAVVACLTAVAAGLVACSADEEPCDLQADAALQAWAEAGFSGSIAVSTGSETTCLAAWGFADRESEIANSDDTVFAIGSVSKSFTAATVLKLVDAGEVSLDDRAGEIVRDLDGPIGDATVEQLLLHTSGLTGSHGSDHEPLGRDAAVQAIGALELAFEPGAGYLYSNAGYTLLALIVEETSGMNYRDYLMSNVVTLDDDVTGGFWDGEPTASGPRAIGYLDSGRTEEIGDFDGPHWALTGNGDVAMITQQLATWTRALFTGDLLSAEATQMLDELAFDHGDGTFEVPGWVVYDAAVFGVPFFMSAGGGGDIGHNVVVVWVPDSEQVIAIASNTPDVTAEELLKAVGPALIAGEPVPTPRGPLSPDAAADITAALGEYNVDTGGRFTVTERDGAVAVAAAGADAVNALFPPAGGFSGDDVAAHEEQVMALLAGETQEGREELELLEDDLGGAIDDVELAGTIVTLGEMRTYVTVVAGSTSTLIWYALNDRGGIEGVEGPTKSPTLVLIPLGDGRFRPDDPTGSGPDLTVEFEEGRMTISGPDGSTHANLAS
jgi:CubicO group peptidase (beta-lactamase class C family)